VAYRFVFSRRVLKGNLHRIHVCTLSRNTNGQASNHETGIESSHPSHTANSICATSSGFGHTVRDKEIERTFA